LLNWIDLYNHLFIIDQSSSKKQKEKDIKDIFENTQKNKLLEKELEAFTGFHEKEVEEILANGNENESFMFKYFPTMFKNKKNFYVHIKKKKERRKNESIYSIKMSDNPLISIKHNTMLSKLEVIPNTIDLRPTYKKIWDSTVLEDEKSNINILKIIKFT